MRTVIEAAGAVVRDQLLVVFVHGWKHSAAPGDDNIKTFRKVLRGLSDAETALEPSLWKPLGLDPRPRGVVGVYLVRRGGSVQVPLLKELTFWNRKDWAHKVGYGAVSVVLSRLEQVKRTKEATEGGRNYSKTPLMIIGHSFGGLSCTRPIRRYSPMASSTMPDRSAG
jgi:hypothetical protein